MRRFIFAALLLAALPSVASATCTGSDWMQTCRDNEGNTYTVNRFGNTTTVRGNNTNDGSSWSQRSTTWGNTTQTTGTAANGNSWNETERHYGGNTTYSGTDSDGQPYSYTCTQYGGCPSSR